jgi:hypothetical protein
VDFELPAKNISDLLATEKREISNSNGEKILKIAVPISIELNIAKLINWNTTMIILMENLL